MYCLSHFQRRSTSRGYNKSSPKHSVLSVLKNPTVASVRYEKTERKDARTTQSISPCGLRGRSRQKRQKQHQPFGCAGEFSLLLRLYFTAAVRKSKIIVKRSPTSRSGICASSPAGFLCACPKQSGHLHYCPEQSHIDSTKALEDVCNRSLKSGWSFFPEHTWKMLEIWQIGRPRHQLEPPEA